MLTFIVEWAAFLASAEVLSQSYLGGYFSFHCRVDLSLGRGHMKTSPSLLRVEQERKKKRAKCITGSCTMLQVDWCGPSEVKFHRNSSWCKLSRARRKLCTPSPIIGCTIRLRCYIWLSSTSEFPPMDCDWSSCIHSKISALLCISYLHRK